jgi:hypothetical protein
MERLCGHDEALLAMARVLVAESADDYREGPLFWSEIAGQFVEGLVARHVSRPSCRGRATFSKEVLKRLRDYVMTTNICLDSVVCQARLQQVRFAGSPRHDVIDLECHAHAKQQRQGNGQVRRSRKSPPPARPKFWVRSARTTTYTSIVK